MHESAMLAARKFADKYVSRETSLRIADIGAMDVNGSMRPIFPGHQYTGIDIQAGKGVDLVIENPETFPIPDGAFDLAISANTLEHTRRPWIVVKEMARILRPGGLMFLLVPMAHPYHAYPIDCWRCYTEGMRGLFQEAGLEVLELWEEAAHDTVGIARKG